MWLVYAPLLTPRRAPFCRFVKEPESDSRSERENEGRGTRRKKKVNERNDTARAPCVTMERLHTYHRPVGHKDRALWARGPEGSQGRQNPCFITRQCERRGPEAAREPICRILAIWKTRWKTCTKDDFFPYLNLKTKKRPRPQRNGMTAPGRSVSVLRARRGPASRWLGIGVATWKCSGTLPSLTFILLSPSSARPCGWCLGKGK